MLPQYRFFQPSVSTIRPYSSGLVLVLLVSGHSPRLISCFYLPHTSSMPDTFGPCVSILPSYSSSQRILPYRNKYKISPFQDCCSIILTVQATVPPVSNQQATIYCSKRWSSEPCVLPSFSYISSLSPCVSTTLPYSSSLSTCVSKFPPYTDFHSHYGRTIHQLFIVKLYC